MPDPDVASAFPEFPVEEFLDAVALRVPADWWGDLPAAGPVPQTYALLRDADAADLASET